MARRIPTLEVAIDVGRGPVVVLLHGIASTAVTFENLVPLLTPNHRVIALNLLGCGNSPAPDEIDYTVDDHVEAVRRTLIKLRVWRPFTLVGHSMGGLIAARFASVYGKWVKRAVLAGAPIYPPMQTVINPVDRAQLGFYQTFYDYLKANPQFTGMTASALNALSPIKNVIQVTERGWEATKRSMTNVIQGQTTLTDLTLVSSPVELVYGTLDPFLSKVGTDAAARINHVTAHPVDLVDHVIRPAMAAVIADLV
ncbi:MAG: alpha/beta fold hydrolase [Microbacteriaceae bacterium]